MRSMLADRGNLILKMQCSLLPNVLWIPNLPVDNETTSGHIAPLAVTPKKDKYYSLTISLHDKGYKSITRI